MKERSVINDFQTFQEVASVNIKPVFQNLIDPDVLTIEDVALLFRCSVDTARRIPKDELPVYRGPGRSRLYLREDLITYLKSRRIDAPISAEFLDEVLRC